MRFEIEGKGSDEQVVKIGLRDCGGSIMAVATPGKVCDQFYLLRFMPGVPLRLSSGIPKSLGFPLDRNGRVLIEGMVPAGSVSPAAERVLAWIKDPAARRPHVHTSGHVGSDECQQNKGWNACLDALNSIAGG
jgi:hypothetical protein